MTQKEMFHETLDECLDTLIKQLGGYKRVATKLWPNMKIASAQTKLSNCFRDDKDEALFKSRESFWMRPAVFDVVLAVSVLALPFLLIMLGGR